MASNGKAKRSAPKSKPKSKGKAASDKDTAEKDNKPPWLKDKGDKKK